MSRFWTLLDTTVLWLVCLVSVIAGIRLLFWTDAIQRSAVKHASTYRRYPILKWFAAGLESSWYRVELRLIGIVSLMAGLVAAYFLVRKLLGG